MKKTTKQKPKPSLRKNTLVEYQGGGYDGCMWEWNYAYIDHTGEFHSIFASGIKGCKSLDDLRDYIATSTGSPHGDAINTYSTTSKAALQRFTDHAPVNGMKGVANWFAENVPDIILHPMCSECGERFDATDGSLEGLHGCGGIASCHRDIVCPDCQGRYSCDSCQEFYGSGYKGWTKDENGEQHCEYCVDEKKRKAELRAQAK